MLLGINNNPSRLKPGLESGKTKTETRWMVVGQVALVVTLFFAIAALFLFTESSNEIISKAMGAVFVVMGILCMFKPLLSMFIGMVYSPLVTMVSVPALDFSGYTVGLLVIAVVLYWALALRTVSIIDKLTFSQNQ